MKFYGEKNLTVFATTNPRDLRKKKVLCKFDENGEFETTDETLIKKLTPHFKTKEVRKRGAKNEI